MDWKYKLESLEMLRRTFTILELLLVLLLSLAIVYLLQYLWNRRHLYELSVKIAGPPVNPIFGNALSFVGKSTSEILKYFVDNFKIYRSPFRFWILNRLYIVVTKPKDLEIIMSNPNCIEKDEHIYKPLYPYIGRSLVTAPEKTWRKNRKIINPAFNKRILQTFVARFNIHFKVLFEQMKTHAGKDYFDIFPYMNRCTLDVLLDTVMGVKKPSSNKELYIECLNGAFEMITLKMYNIGLNFEFIYNRTKYVKQSNAVLKIMRSFTETVIKERKEIFEKSRENNEVIYDGRNGQNKKILLEYLIEIAQDDGIDFTAEELREEINALMIAGSDTTAGTSCFIFVMLGLHPEVQEKMYQEVINVIGPDRPVEHTDLPHFKYTEMVIKETMRLFPGVPLVYRTIKEDIKLDSCTLPAGCSAMIPIILAQRDPEIWKDPLKFDPDRFLPEEVAKRHPYSWVPFSGGARNCIGMQFALINVKSLMASAIRKFKFYTDYKSVEDIELKPDVFLKTTKGHRIFVELRE